MSEKIVIDVDVAMALLREARSQKGWDYIDPDSQGTGWGCKNAKWVSADGESTDQGEGELVPSCIVGHVLFYAGVDIDLLASFSGAVQSTKEQLIKALGEDEFEMTPNAEVVLLVAQRHQDDGKDWGSAVDRAEDVAQIFKKAGTL